MIIVVKIFKIQLEIYIYVIFNNSTSQYLHGNDLQTRDMCLWYYIANSNNHQ